MLVCASKYEAFGRIVTLKQNKLSTLKENALKLANSYTWENFAKGIFNELYK